MRATKWLVIAACAPSAVLHAQEEDAGTDPLSEVKAPQFPAAVMLGVQPATINRPKSWKAFETAVFS